jgi:hypothetical protein
MYHVGSPEPEFANLFKEPELVNLLRSPESIPSLAESIPKLLKSLQIWAQKCMNYSLYLVCTTRQYIYSCTRV